MSNFRLKIIAIFAMLIDHIGWILFPQIIFLRIIGRLAFPIFAFLIAEGSTKTQNINSYIKRILIFGIISQLPYSYSAYLAQSNYYTLNIFFTLGFGLILIKFIQEKKYFGFYFLFFIFVLLDFFINYDYGIYGIILILLFYLFIKNKFLGILSVISLTILESIHSFKDFAFRDQIFSIFALIPIFIYNGNHGRKISKWFFYIFYPLHLAILSLVFHLL